jgi:response regulator RpfG family c-di-GMP phosphodiesterase
MSVFKRENLIKLEEQQRKVKKHTIMIVDDEEAHLSTLEFLLSDEYHIITSRDGQEALDMITKMKNPGSIGIIISDQRMPKLTGIQFFEKLKDILPNTIRIILTGFDDKEVMMDAINKARIHKFILKPFEPEELKLIVKHAIEAYESQVKKEEYRRTLEEQTKKLEQKKKKLEEATEKLAESITISTSVSDDSSTGLRK